jgi:hypothetical protein
MAQDSSHRQHSQMFEDDVLWAFDHTMLQMGFFLANSWLELGSTSKLQLTLPHPKIH